MSALPFQIPTAELISTGSELLSGRTLNRHAFTLGGALRDLGIELLRDTTIPDDPAAIRDSVSLAIRRSAIVVVSGGLGPTRDDVTREAVAEVLGRGIQIHPEARRHLEDWFSRNGKTVNETALRQALVLDGARMLPNRAGIAPGQCLEVGSTVLYLLPGPPREFQAILDDHLLPDLRRRYTSITPLAESVTMFSGLGESDLQSWVDAQSVPEGIVEGYCAGPGRLEFRLSTRDPSQAAMASRLMDAARERFREFVFSENRQALESTVADLLLAGSQTLAVAESCTGGLLGAAFTALPGSSNWFVGGVVCYSNASKIRDLGVASSTLIVRGAVSPECAMEMARGGQGRFGATWAVSITGVTGPTGGTPSKPVGTVFIAVAGPTGCRAQHYLLNGDRETVREFARQRAVDQLWRELRSHAANGSSRPSGNKT